MPRIVYPECFNTEGYCLHWVQDTVDDVAIWQSNCRVGPMCPKDTPGNAYWLISEEYRNYMLNNKPKRVMPPTCGYRPVTTLKVRDRIALVESMYDVIGSDCYSVYSRNFFHEVIEVYYKNSLIDEQSGADNTMTIAQCSNRTELLKDNSVLVAALDDGLEIAMSLGDKPFIDVYYRRISDGKYVEVTVSK